MSRDTSQTCPLHPKLYLFCKWLSSHWLHCVWIHSFPHSQVQLTRSAIGFTSKFTSITTQPPCSDSVHTSLLRERERKKKASIHCTARNFLPWTPAYWGLRLNLQSPGSCGRARLFPSQLIAWHCLADKGRLSQLWDPLPTSSLKQALYSTCALVSSFFLFSITVIPTVIIVTAQTIENGNGKVFWNVSGTCPSPDLCHNLEFLKSPKRGVTMLIVRCYLIPGWGLALLLHLRQWADCPNCFFVHGIGRTCLPYSVGCDPLLIG